MCRKLTTAINNRLRREPLTIDFVDRGLTGEAKAVYELESVTNDRIRHLHGCGPQLPEQNTRIYLNIYARSVALISCERTESTHGPPI